MRKTLCIIALLMLLMSAFGQTCHLFTSDRELSSTMINKIYQDHNNMIWIATEDGLNRYDGSKFTTYKNIPNNPHSLCNNYVRTIFEDSKGHLLIGTYDGIQMYNPATDNFSKKALCLNDIPFDSNIIDIAERKNGEIWISGNILCTLKISDNKLYAKKIDFDTPIYYTDLMIEDDSKNMWISNGDNGIFCILPNKKVKKYLYDISNLSITTLYKDKHGIIYVGTIGKGLLKYSKEKDAFISINNNTKDELPIKTIYVDNKNTMYIGTDGKGIKMLSSNGEYIYNSHINNNFFDENKAKVHSILIDKAGNTWIAIYQKGIMMIPAKSNHFNYIGHKSINKNIIGNSCITSFCRDNKYTLDWYR